MGGELEFVDTNVVVYAHDSTAGNKRAVASELLERLDVAGTGAISVQVLQEFVVTAGAKVQPPISDEEIAALVEDLSDWTVFCPGSDDVLAALELRRRHQMSFWDAMILRAASELDASVLWTEDLSHGRDYDGVTARNPFRTEDA